MKNNFLSVSVNMENIVLSSKCLFYKTENFITQTKYVSDIDTLLAKLCEGIVLNLNEILSGENLTFNHSFLIETMDKNYKFVFKFGSQINNELNGSDIIFCEFLEKDKLNESKFSVKEYLKQRKTLNFMIQRINKTQAVQDFNKLYLILNLSGVNLPRLSNLQREIVETVDKNILVQGVAGSGKTNICIDKIIFTACKNFSGKVLYTTFSRGLLIDTKLKVEAYKKDLEDVLLKYQENKVKFLDDDHKKALENRLGIFFFSDDDNQIFEKIKNIINNLTNKVDYLLIEDLYKEKFGEADFVNESYFINFYSNNLENHQIEKAFSKLYRYSKEIIYKEIYGMIFGFYNLEENPEIMPLDKYIENRQNSFSKVECETIYQIALDFKKHCEKYNLLDNNLASKRLIEKIDRDFEYSLSIIDEVQDYTQANLCLFKKLSLKLFCVGDAQQMINPSYFNFGYLKNLLFEKDLTEVKELKQNFRNTIKIAEIIDSLGEINKSEFGTHNFVLNGQSVDSGINSTTVFVENGSQFVNSISKSKLDNFTFVVSNVNQKKKLKELIFDQEVLTVSEIKGLERDTIVTFNLLSDNFDKWKILEQNKVNHKLADENSVFRYYYNLFYVGLSRSKQNLFVIENSKISQFESFFKQNFDRLDNAKALSKLKDIVKTVEFTQEQAIARVKEFIKLEQFDNARFTANKIRVDSDRLNAMRTIDIHEEFVHFGKYREAGIKFWEYGMIEEAKKQFTISGDEILIELIDVLSKNNKKDLNIDIVNYYDDVKDNKIAQQFIIETVQKDVKNLKNSFNKIKENFKKGRL